MATLKLVLEADKNTNVPMRLRIIITKTENGSNGLRSHRINPQYENTLYHGSIYTTSLIK
jgi:hypothetical protein